MDVSEIAADLVAEQQALDAVVAGVGSQDWGKATASPGWTVADQIGHLSYFDNAAAVAITDPEQFKTMLGELMQVGGTLGADDLTLGAFRALSPGEQLERWRENRSALTSAATTLANDTRVAWYGPSMGSKSFLTARLMECWAHGQDIVDTVGVNREATDRLRHIAQLGFITRGWSYLNRKTKMPEADVRLDLTSPSGEQWAYGPDDTTDVVAGSAEDFCLVVTQRRHVDATGLTTTGDAARDWMLIAQAYAGPPTDGPKG
jgi:uncharacterized protein (TIGR03084 family)